MNLLNLKSSLLIAVICFVLGFAGAFLLMGQCNDSDTSTQSIVQVKELEKQIASKETVFQTKLSELQKRNQQLQQELTSTQVELFTIKLKSKKKEDNIKKLIQPKGLPAKELLKKVGKPAIAIDNNLSPCDSLAEEVSEYIEVNAIKDSLYETKIGLQDSVIAVKDSVINTHVKFNRELKAGFSTSLEQQELLSAENAKLKKKIKRQKRRSKLINIGAMILSGLATNYFFNH